MGIGLLGKTIESRIGKPSLGHIIYYKLFQISHKYISYLFISNLTSHISYFIVRETSRWTWNELKERPILSLKRMFGMKSDQILKVFRKYDIISSSVSSVSFVSQSLN